MDQGADGSITGNIDYADGSNSGSYRNADGSHGSSAEDSEGNGQFVFFAAFDGTNNDRDHVEVSGNPQSTNVGQLEQQLRDANTNNQNFTSKYYSGPGAPQIICH